MRLGVGVARLRREPGAALGWLRAIARRRPADLEARLLLAELELASGDVERAIDEAGIAIQLAPDDVRGMSLLLQAEAHRHVPPPCPPTTQRRDDRTADYNLL